jgi:replication factor A1
MQGGSYTHDTSVGIRKTISAIKEENLGNSEKGDILVVKGMIDYIVQREGQEGPWYVSDPETKYKCVEQTDGSYFCEKSSKTIPNPQRRYIMTVAVKDHTGSHFVSLFDAEAEKLLGHSADELSELVRNGDTGKVEAIYKAALFTECIITLKVKSETYQEESRVKVVANAFNLINFADESKQLIDAINAY